MRLKNTSDQRVHVPTVGKFDPGEEFDVPDEMADLAKRDGFKKVTKSTSDKKENS